MFVNRKHVKINAQLFSCEPAHQQWLKHGCIKRTVHCVIPVKVADWAHVSTRFYRFLKPHAFGPIEDEHCSQSPSWSADSIHMNIMNDTIPL